MGEIGRILAEEGSRYGIHLGDEEVRRLERYATLLLEGNRTMNLTRVTAPEEVAIKHLLDALLGWVEVRRVPGLLFDVGSGGGVPGVVLACVEPGRRVVLVESSRKKAGFLQEAVRELGLRQVEVLAARAEEVARDRAWREQGTWATGRAVAPLGVLLEYTLPLVRVGGSVLAYKGPAGVGEWEAARGMAAVLGSGRARLVEHRLPRGYGTRILVLVEKGRRTPARFPRPGGGARGRG